jgi:hypothetical protein
VLNPAELRTRRLPSLDGRGLGRVETGDVRHPHPTSPVKGEEFNSTALGGLLWPVRPSNAMAKGMVDGFKPITNARRKRQRRWLNCLVKGAFL